MWFLIAPCPGCPFRDDDHKKGDKREADLREENSRLKERMIEEGLNIGGSVYVTGQTKGDLK